MDIIQALIPRRLTKRQVGMAVVLFVAYFIAAQLGTRLFIPPAVVFPASGIALAGLILEGIELWPVIFIAALFDSWVSGGVGFNLWLLSAAHTIDAVVGTYLLQKLGFNGLFRRLRDMVAFLFVGFMISSIVPAIGFLSRFLNAMFLGIPPSSHITWGSWWVGIMTSFFVVGPLVIRWGWKFNFTRTKREWIETTIAFVILIIITALASWGGVSQIMGISAVYLILAPLFYIAIRSGPRFMTLAIFLTAAIAFSGVILVPSPGVDVGNMMFQTQTLIDIIAIISFLLTSLEEERREAVRVLSAHVHQLEDTTNRLEAQDRAKNDFIAVLAHELRNPLAPVVSSLELLRLKKLLSGEAQQIADIMEGSLRSVRRLLDDLLDVSRISQNKLRLQKDPLDVGSIVLRSVASVKDQVDKREQTLLVNLPKTPLILDADPIRIEQVFTNLLSNASKFTQAGGHITMSAAEVARMAEIHIRDDGMGIDPSMLKRIFEPFLQLEFGGRRNEGLGIGLALTQEIVILHGGTIEAKSPGHGKGSEFILRLPLSSAPLRKAKPAEIIASPFPIPKRRVLIVDDNAAAARGIGSLLSFDGHEVAYAHTGTDAKTKLSQWNPDIILLDIGLPDTDGYVIAKEMRNGRNFKGTLIALTGYGQEDDKAKALKAGFDFHLVKPVGIDDVRAALVQIV